MKTKSMKKETPKTSALMTVLIAVVLLTAAALTAVYVVDFWGNDSKGGVPSDNLEAALKLQNAGYTVEYESEQMLSSLTTEASDHYNIAFSGKITAYLEVYDTETKELKAEIFYMEYAEDAELLYQKMKEGWEFSKEEGELRYSGNTVYMGKSEALNALEK